MADSTFAPSRLFSLEGRRALVTGGSRGIGAAIAEGLLAAGAQVTITARHSDELEATAARLCRAGFRTLEEVADADEETLVAVEDIGPKVAASLREHLGRDNTKAELARLRELGVDLDVRDEDLPPQVAADAPLAGLTVVVTGTIADPRSGEKIPRPTFQRLVERAGATTASSVSANTDMLICGTDVGASKITKAEKLEVEVVDQRQAPQPDLEDVGEEQVGVALGRGDPGRAQPVRRDPTRRARAHSGLQGRQAGGHVGLDARVEHRREVAVEHLVEVVGLVAGAVVGDPVLGEVVGPDPLRAVDRADLGASRIARFRIRCVLRGLEQP